jgi:hypothetical protein
VAASISKRGHINTIKAFENTPCRVLALIHDELLIEIPGQWTIDPEKSFKTDNEFKPYFEVDDEAKHWASIAAGYLEEAEEFYFKNIYKGDDFCFTGLTDQSFAPYWAH